MIVYLHTRPAERDVTALILRCLAACVETQPARVLGVDSSSQEAMTAVSEHRAGEGGQP